MALETGMTSEFVNYTFTKESVEKFNRALGIDESHPMFNQVSPTLPIQLMIELDSPWKNDIPHPLVHGRQVFNYKEQLKVDEVYQCRLRLNRVRQMKSEGKDALMFEQIIECFQDDELKFSGSSLLIGYLS